MRATTTLIAVLLVLVTIQGAMAATTWIQPLAPALPGTTSTPVDLCSDGVCAGVDRCPERGATKIQTYASSYECSQAAPGTATSSSSSSSDSGATSIAPGDPSFKVTSTTFTNGIMHVTGTITNPADGQEVSGVIELQARKTGAYLSFFAPQPTPCDPTTPENVHATFDVTPGSSVQVDFSSDVTALGKGTYDFYLVSVTQCCAGTNGCDAVKPFGWQTLIAHDVPYGTGQATAIACTADFQCGPVLDLPASSDAVTCMNAGTSESYCVAKEITSSATSSSPGAMNVWSILLIVVGGIAGILFLLWIVRRLGFL